MKIAPYLWWALFLHNVDNILKIWYNIGVNPDGIKLTAITEDTVF